MHVLSHKKRIEREEEKKETFVLNTPFFLFRDEDGEKETSVICARTDFPFFLFFLYTPSPFLRSGEHTAHASKEERTCFPRSFPSQERVSKKQSVASLFTPPIFRKKRPLVGTAKFFFLEKCKGINFCLNFFTPLPPNKCPGVGNRRCGRVKVGAGKPFFSFLQFLPHHSPSSPLGGVSSFISHILDVLRLKKPTVKNLNGEPHASK